MFVRIKVLDTGRGRRIELAGSIQVRNARQLHAASLEAWQANGEVIVDWREAERLDGSAFQILAALDEAVRSRGGKLEFTASAPALDPWLPVSGFDARFPRSYPAESKDPS